jgi:sn-glycerol 3-phosphate transport system permease protein
MTGLTALTWRVRLGIKLAPYGLLAPSAVFLLGFTYWPVLRVLAISLTVRGFRGAEHWGISNFSRLFADAHFGRAALNNLIYTVGTIAPSLMLALAFAVGLRESTRLSSLMRTLVALPMLIPMVAAASLFVFIFLPGAGLLDHYLAAFGVQETNWLGDPSLALGSIVAITVWRTRATTCCSSWPASPVFLRNCWTQRGSMVPAPRSDSCASLSRCSGRHSASFWSLRC